MNPTIGRIIHAVILDAKGVFITRPAIITRTWGDGSTAVQATVFPDAANDGRGEALPCSSLLYDPNSESENTWHWPPLPKFESTPLAAVAELRSSNSLAAPIDAISEELLKLSYEIEQLPASGQQTTLSLHASDIRQKVRELFALM